MGCMAGSSSDNRSLKRQSIKENYLIPSQEGAATGFAIIAAYHIYNAITTGNKAYYFLAATEFLGTLVFATKSHFDRKRLQGLNGNENDITKKL